MRTITQTAHAVIVIFGLLSLSVVLTVAGILTRSHSAKTYRQQAAYYLCLDDKEHHVSHATAIDWCSNPKNLELYLDILCQEDYKE